MTEIIRAHFNSGKVSFDDSTKKVQVGTSCLLCWETSIVRLTFSGVTLCAGQSWPGDENLNQSYDLPFLTSTPEYGACLYRLANTNYCFWLWLRREDCGMKFHVRNIPNSNFYFCSWDFIVPWDHGSINNIFTIGDCGGIKLANTIRAHSGSVSWEKIDE